MVYSGPASAYKMGRSTARTPRPNSVVCGFSIPGPTIHLFLQHFRISFLCCHLLFFLDDSKV
ncbi:hypothetical protein BC939DRAFT_441533 [Gamsiella multidivaricata]|uniref:uncharacterized protein n=1 Tax=Gamsiella multidivaricata TaxID=101098 RepID=UPI002220D28F|nr:uncharacterized protein BC939DRAFT_441533 [Gamsiella multidivaricata]KAI7829314.1 hypothetical protein BC939DRAFT_441533 [Gamsiella multidivaricata]